jgi:biofilm PGA synthesis N-glycosyltransferase PgaC
VIAFVPAHNEEDRITATLSRLLEGQTRPPDWVVAVCDNCTDRTAQVAESLGAKIMHTNGNTWKKAGALNQAIGRSLPWLQATDVILVVDADTELGPNFIAAALREINAGAGACGGVFYGEDGGGLLGTFQRAEYARYARQLARSQKDARVLTGTGTAFTVEALRALGRARNTRRLPGRMPGDLAPVYTSASLTEDGEITLALKTLGFRCVSPGDCTVTTEVMTSLPAWWKQRTRWTRGALEDLRTYGRTSVTWPYILRQCAMGLSVLAFALYIGYALAMITMFGYHTNVFWLGVSAFFVFERVWTVRRAGWREKITAALVLPELVYDALQHAVWLWCVSGTLLRTRTEW